jgi:D-beta-D-heptose 7-phosphate kinase / D-beta-D-heptose 1-phosphate adenosyltransferase
MTPAEIVERLFSQKYPSGCEPKVLVVGDAILDQYIFGRSERLCPEAPVPVFIEETRDVRAGGAANVHAQIETLNVLAALHAVPLSERTIKARYMIGQHMLLRVDVDARGFGSCPDRGEYEELALMLQQEPDVVVISDYNKGWVTAQTIQMCLANGARVLVDPKGSWGKYKGAYLLTPNRKETIGNGGHCDPEFDNILFKLGADGMQLATQEALTHIPASAHRVYDVTGAGDTVIATVAAALAVGADLLGACQLAALAAGYVVGEVGTAVCPLEKLKELAK